MTVTAPGTFTGALRRLPLRPPVTGRFVLRRLLEAVVAVAGAVTVVFVMITATGNPANVLAPDDATPEQIAKISAQFGFDQPLYVQYALFVGNVFSGRFPTSLWNGDSSLSVVLERVPATLVLSGSAVCLGALLGLVIGYFSVYARRRFWRSAPLAVMNLVQSTPSFFLAVILVLVFAVNLRLLPTGGYTSPLSFVLPVVTLSAYVAPGIARIFRASILESSAADHVTTAFAAGLRVRTVRIRDIAVNALGPAISLIGLQVGGILGGAVIVETIFSWPGIGQLLVASVGRRDYPVALAAVTVISIGYVFSSLITDVVSGLVNPAVLRTR